jgi:hypothetical protein
VSCNVGDWVEVTLDYSPGKFSEGGTGVIIAKSEGEGQVHETNQTKPLILDTCVCIGLGLATVKYIYGQAMVSAAQEGVIGSSIQGRIENGIVIGRLTTIVMPMKGALIRNVVCMTQLCMNVSNNKSHIYAGADPELRPRVHKQDKTKESPMSPLKLASVDFGRNDPTVLLKSGLRTVRHLRWDKGGIIRKNIFGLPGSTDLHTRPTRYPRGRLQSTSCITWARRRRKIFVHKEC